MYPYCPFMYDPDMFRSEEEETGETISPETAEPVREEYQSREESRKDGKAKEENVENNEERQFPGAVPGPQYPGAGAAPQYPGQYPGQFPINANQIVRYIEQNDPAVINTMLTYGIPLAIARRILRRIVNITLRFCRII